MLNTVLFDLDGTLVDSAPDLHAAISEMLLELGRPTLTLAEVVSFIGNGVQRLVERSLIAAGGLKDEAETAQALFSSHYAKHPARLSRLNPGVAVALADLHARGIRVGVCTNKPQTLAEMILAQFGLSPLLGAIVGGDGLRPLKPDPAPLRECMSRLRSSERNTLYVGDSEVDEETAKRAALPFALFSGGYRAKPIEDMRTVLVFSQFDELARWVLSDRAASSQTAG